MTESKKAVVIFSGGQDSTTCLGLALKKFGKGNVCAISFNYGQKHAVELECAQRITTQLDVPLTVVDMPFFGNLVTSALLSDDKDVNEGHEYKKDLPASFVPNRNALFITVAHAYAQEVGATVLYTGVCETDYSGYPDCRLGFIKSIQDSLNLGYETDIEILTPLMRLNKAETFALADEVGILDLVVEQTHTCYNGDHDTKNDWGYGCGECGACKLRAQGHKEFMLTPEIM